MPSLCQLASVQFGKTLRSIAESIRNWCILERNEGKRTKTLKTCGAKGDKFPPFVRSWSITNAVIIEHRNLTQVRNKPNRMEIRINGKLDLNLPQTLKKKK